MWRSSVIRLSSSFQKAGCPRLFSSTRQKLASEGSASSKPQPPCKPGSEESMKAVQSSSPPTPSPPPLRPRKEGSVAGTIFRLIGVTVVGTGGALGYAWYDPSFRKILEDNLPYSKDAMDIIFEYLPPSPSDSSATSPPPAKLLESENKPLSFSAPPEKLTVTKPDDTSIETSREDSKLTVQKTRDEQTRLLEKKVKEKEAEEAAENAALEVIIEKLVLRSRETAEQAMAMQKKLVESTKSHTALLKKAMEDTSEILDKDRQWQHVSEAFKQRDNLSQETEKVVTQAKHALEQLKDSIETGKKNKVTQKNKVLSFAQENYNKISNDFRTVTTEVLKSESDARVMIRYKDLIERGRKQFAQELESIVPDVKLGSRSKKLTEEELNSLIAHAHRRIEQLQKQLAEQLALEAQRVEKAVQQQQLEDAKLTAQQVALEAEKLRDQFAMEKQTWEAEARVELEKELRQQLSRQAAAHSDHLRDVLRVQATELEKQCEREVHTQLLQERQAFQSEVSGWIARLKGIETAVESRAESEKIARVAQDLWLSCIALNGTIRYGNEQAQVWEERLKPLKKELEAVSDAGGKHPFVETLIQTIPEEASERGVWTEESLRDRFPRVKTICKRVAMIDETGGTLFKYFLSYLQSFFVFDSVSARCQHDEVDLEKLSAFSILAHAEYFLEHGDLEQALRFMNQLTGEPRRVASDWIKEARLLLETRQAAYAITAFASASGLGTIF